ncbi:MAG: superoxide dismutase [Ni] [Calditrichaceae bacterium]
MRKIIPALFLLLIIFLGSKNGYSHCEIPCGIYNDQMRVDMISEHVDTIEKSMNQIIELQKATPVDYNQLVRWINNKDDHSEQLQHIVTQYFMTQRLKPVTADKTEEYQKYVIQLSLLHEMLVYSMKAKQTVDPGNITKLRSLLQEFSVAYFGPDYKRHEH